MIENKSYLSDFKKNNKPLEDYEKNIFKKVKELYDYNIELQDKLRELRLAIKRRNETIEKKEEKLKKSNEKINILKKKFEASENISKKNKFRFFIKLKKKLNSYRRKLL